MAQFKSAKTLLDHLVATGGRIVVADADKVMSPLGLKGYKLPTYIWHIREKFQIPVTVEKKGREVTAYVVDLKDQKATDADQVTEDDSVADTVETSGDVQATA